MGERFRILRFHDRGGRGEVYVARDEELHREVALKRIQDQYADDSENRSRFLAEAEITGGLEHPGIVPVYGLGHFDDGRPFYAMRFIRGDSLRDAIKQFHQAEGPGRDPGERSPSLRRLIGRFIDVCNTVAYAHSRGVLHRDLKPGNVMLGPYGETLVVDWGLAKVIGLRDDVPRGEEPSLHPSGDSGHAATLPGSIVGTPAYMSPEQARGDLDLLGPASDVYSLGATLYNLLIGRPAFEHTDHLVLRDRIIAGEFPPPRQVSRGLLPALEAVCLKAMARVPAHRYPSPRALADDLEHWLADEPVSARCEGWAETLARWTRRHRAWAQAGAAALLTVAIVATIAAVVVDRARRNEKAARGEVTRSLLAERAAKETADHNLLLARKAVEEYFTRVSEDTLLKRQDAPSVRDLRELRRDLLSVALRYYQTFATQHADNPALQEELARAHGRVGAITSEIGSKEQALEARRQSLSIWAKLAEIRPSDGDAQRNLAASHFHIGLLQRQLGRSAEALVGYDKALAITERITAEHPERSLQQELGDVLVNRANVLSDVGRRTDAMASYQRALTVFEPLAATDPMNAKYQQNMANVSHNIGVEKIEAGYAAEALVAFERARTIRERLAAAHPTASEYQNQLAQSYKNIGALNSDTNHPAEALASYERAREIRTRMVAENPTVIQFQYDLADTLFHIGHHHNQNGRPDKALASYAEVNTILTKLVAVNPTVMRFQEKLLAVWHNTANIHGDSGRFDEALAGLERARVLRVRMATDHPELPELRHALGILHNDIGTLHYEAGHTDAALSAMENGRAILEVVAAENPQVPGYRRDLANGQNVIGAVHLRAGHLEQALASFKRARVIRAGLAADHSAILQYRIDLAESNVNLGSILARSGRLSEALEAYEQARDVLGNLAETDPAHARVRLYLATAYLDIAGVRSVVGPRDEARTSVERGRALLEALPRPNVAELYQLARAHSLGAYLDSPDPAPTSDEDRVRRQWHTDQAVALLRLAVGAGYRDVAALKNDPSWRPIWQLPDFQLLLLDLNFPNDPFAR